MEQMLGTHDGSVSIHHGLGPIHQGKRKMVECSGGVDVDADRVVSPVNGRTGGNLERDDNRGRMLNQHRRRPERISPKAG